MLKKYTKQDILQFLKQNPVMNISVVYNGNPISSVVLFAVDNNFTFYFATKNTTYKSKALSNHPKISFSVWEHHEMLVQVDGVVNIVPDENSNEVIQFITNSANNVKDFWPPILHASIGEYIYYYITPNWIRAMDLSVDTIARKELPYQIILDKSA